MKSSVGQTTVTGRKEVNTRVVRKIEDCRKMWKNVIQGYTVYCKNNRWTNMTYGVCVNLL